MYVLNRSFYAFFQKISSYNINVLLIFAQNILFSGNTAMQVVVEHWAYKENIKQYSTFFSLLYAFANTKKNFYHRRRIKITNRKCLNIFFALHLKMFHSSHDKNYAMLERRSGVLQRNEMCMKNAFTLKINIMRNNNKNCIFRYIQNRQMLHDVSMDNSIRFCT